MYIYNIYVCSIFIYLYIAITIVQKMQKFVIIKLRVCFYFNFRKMASRSETARKILFS
jgi:hypothetical protein